MQKKLSYLLIFTFLKFVPTRTVNFYEMEYFGLDFYFLRLVDAFVSAN